VTKVLYVEHNDDNLYMLKTRLELRGGFEVFTAEDSEKGCRLAATEHPDVILMDLEMPAGCDEFDAKPIEFESLVATIRRVLAPHK
jgi:DNA-binding NarL/FixJ family response regulator